MDRRNATFAALSHGAYHAIKEGEGFRVSTPTSASTPVGSKNLCKFGGDTTGVKTFILAISLLAYSQFSHHLI